MTNRRILRTDLENLVIRDPKTERWVNSDLTQLIFDRDYQHILLGSYWYAWPSVLKTLYGYNVAVTTPHGKFTLNHESSTQ